MTPSYHTAVERFPRIASFVVTAVGAGVVLGWIFDLNALKSVLPGLATMKINTACAFVATGTGLWLLRTESPASRRIAHGLFITVIAVAGLTLAEYGLAIDVGIDQLILPDDAPSAVTLHPGRMSPATAFNFCLIGAALLTLPRRSSPLPDSRASWLALPVALVSAVALVGHAYDARSLYAFGPYSSMAIHTASLFALLCLAVFCADPTRVFIGIVIGDTAAGIVSRRLLPALTLALFVLGWLSLAGQNAGLYGSHAGLAIAVVASMTAAAIAIAGTVSALNEMDLRRARAETALVAANAALEERVAARTLELARSLEAAVAERRRAEASENELAVSEGYLDFALRSHQLGSWLIDLKNHTAHRNLMHGRIFGYSAPLPTWTMERFLDHVIPADRPAVERTLRAAAVAQTDWTFECRILRADGAQRNIRASGIHIRDATGMATKMHGLVQDITERRRVEDLQQQLTALIDSADDAIVSKTLDGVILSWNPAAERLLGYRAEEIVGQSVGRLLPEDRQEEESKILARLTDGERVAHFETVRRRKDGTPVDVSLTISPICDRTGVVLGASTIMRDITERKRSMEQLARLNAELETRVQARTCELREREILLQEIHHRVKNNLQVISSLINLQIRSLDDSPSRGALRQCQSRVATMAQIHEMLYQAKDYARIPFAKYARELAARVLCASGMSSTDIVLRFDCEELALEVEKAIPCGLILNELISNALKYAFPHARSGVIRIEIRQAADDSILMAVADDGIGLAPDFDPLRANSLGLRLVNTLVTQLDGRLEIDRRSGTAFRFTFRAESAP